MDRRIMLRGGQQIKYTHSNSVHRTTTRVLVFRWCIMIPNGIRQGSREPCNAKRQIPKLSQSRNSQRSGTDHYRAREGVNLDVVEGAPDDTQTFPATAGYHKLRSTLAQNLASRYGYLAAPDVMDLPSRIKRLCPARKERNQCFPRHLILSG